jgi:hypothetical protein
VPVRWITLFGTSCLSIVASAAAAERLNDGGLSIHIPSQQRIEKPTGVDLLPDGGFEGVTLLDAKAPAWQVATHVFSYDQEGVKAIARRLTEARVAEIRDTGSLEGKCHLFLKNPEDADQWRGGIRGPAFTTYVARYAAIPPLTAPGRLTLTLAYKAKLSRTAANSQVRATVSFFPEAREPWRHATIGPFLQFPFDESPAWRREQVAMLVPPEARGLRLLLYLDGCGEVGFDDVHLYLDQWPPELEIKLYPFAWLDNTFCVSRNGPGMLCLALRNPRGIALKSPMAVIELPREFPMLDARFGIASRAPCGGGGTRYRIPLTGLRGVLAKPRDDYEIYNMLDCLVWSSVEASERTFPARYWVEDGDRRSTPQSFVLKSIAARHASPPQLFRSGAVVSHEFDLTTPAAMQAAVRFYAAQGFNCVQIYPHTQISRLFLEGGLERYLGLTWLDNGYHLGQGPKPDAARMVQPDGTFHPDGICPQEVIERGPYFRSEIEAPLRRHLVTDRTADQIMPNWEPYMYRDKGCLCDRCKREFAAFSKLPGAEIAACWPKEVIGRHRELWDRFRAYQHGRMVVTLEQTIRALGREAKIDSHFIPAIAASSLTQGDYQRKHFSEIDPYAYAAELPWLEPWGPYVYRPLFTPHPFGPGRQLLVYRSACEIMDHLARGIQDPAQRPKLIAYPHGQQGQDWVTEPESLAMQVLSYFAAGWRGAFLYHYPRGYDARWWNAVAEANETIAGCEQMVYEGALDPRARLIALTPMPAKAAFTAREEQEARVTYPTALEASLLQGRAWRKGPSALVAAGNFWEDGPCIASLSLPGLAADKRYAVSDRVAGLRFTAEHSDSWSAAELARGVLIQVPALRWRFLIVEPADGAKPESRRVSPSALQALLSRTKG